MIQITDLIHTDVGESNPINGRSLVVVSAQNKYGDGGARHKQNMYFITIFGNTINTGL